MRNRYSGTCYQCKKEVLPGQGHFERFMGGWRVHHWDCCIIARNKREEMNTEPRVQVMEIDEVYEKFELEFRGISFESKMIKLNNSLVDLIGAISALVPGHNRMKLTVPKGLIHAIEGKLGKLGNGQCIYVDGPNGTIKIEGW